MRRSPRLAETTNWRAAVRGHQTATFVASLLLAVLGWAGPSTVLNAGAGNLDPGFGTGGKVVTDFLGGVDQAFAIAIQPDGRLVAGGRHGGPTDVEGLAADFALARYTADGSLDPGFATGGRVVTDFGAGEAIRGIAIQPDGRIVAAGSSSGSLALARYNADGSLDRVFGPHLDGKVTASAFDVSGVALQPDGRIVVAGTSGFDFALARFNTDGSPDITFGPDSNGRITTDFGYTEFASAVALQPTDDKLVVVGSAQNPSTGAYRFALARHHPNGTLDASFGTNGRVLTAIGSQSFANAVAIQPDGDIVVAGSWSDDVGQSGFALARYRVNGTLDPTFGNGGVATTVRIGAEARAVAVQADGRIVAAGGSRFLLMAYNADGSPDLVFGPNGDGVVVTDLGVGAQANALLLQPDGQLVATGSGSGRIDFAVVRYDMTRPITVPNQSPDVTPGPNQEVFTCLGCLVAVTLAGAATDPDNDPLQFQWRENGDPLPPGPTPTVFLGVGTHTFELAVSDPFETVTGTVVVDVVSAGDIAALVQQLNDANATIAAHETTIADQQTQVTGLTNERNGLAGDKARLQGELDVANGTIAARDDTIAGLQTDLSTAHQTIADRNARIATLETDLDTTNQTIVAREATIAGLQTDLATANQTIADRTVRIATLETDLETASQTIAARDATIAGLQTDFGAANQMIASLTRQLSAANTSIAELNAQIASLRQMLRSALADPTFTIPGTTPLDQIENLINAINRLNPGQKLALYKNLGGMKGK